MGLWCTTKSGFYTTTSDDQLSGCPERKLQSTFQSQTHTKKKVMVTLGGLLPIWSTIAFWIPVKPLLRHILSKSMRCTENCVYSQHWSTERAQFFSMTFDYILHNQHFKSWTNWGTKFHHICQIHLISRQLTNASSSILTTFCRENASTTSRQQKTLSKSLSNPKAWIFIL